jgi:uncharacterized NAD(P)/FAD-binding protein YdhS
MEVAIVGMGFCGMMTAIHLAEKSTGPITLHLISDSQIPSLGPAYSTSCHQHLLNVPAGNMSARSKSPGDFLHWLIARHGYSEPEREMLSRMFACRMEYGEYLNDVWNEMLKNRARHVEIQKYNSRAVAISENDKKTTVLLHNGEQVLADKIVLATGNEKPANPVIKNNSFFESATYISNPWNQQAVKNIDGGKNVFVIGNGLTMVDVVLSLNESKLSGTIYSLSPHGFTMLPHRHNGVAYTQLVSELKEPYEINSLFTLFRKHINHIRSFGLSAEPVIDSIRSLSQSIWIKLSVHDKKRFLRHLRHLWGLARHRLPANIHDQIQELRLTRKLVILKGKITDMHEVNNLAVIEFYNKRSGINESITAAAVINCTGPSMDISKSQNYLLRDMIKKNMIRPDELKLGIDTDMAGRVVNTQGKPSENIFTLGGNLRGLLWETTAVPELRVQAENLAENLLKN